MAKMKIYEFARSLQERYPDIKGKDLVKLLQENNFDVKAPQIRKRKRHRKKRKK